MLGLDKGLLYLLSFLHFTFLLFFISWKKGSKLSTFPSSFSLSLTMVSSFVRANLFIFPILIFIVAIIFCSNFLTVLVSLSNIPKLKFFTSADLRASLTLLPWISPPLGAPYYALKTPGNIWDSSLIENCHFTSTSTFT